MLKSYDELREDNEELRDRIKQLEMAIAEQTRRWKRRCEIRDRAASRLEEAIRWMVGRLVVDCKSTEWANELVERAAIPEDSESVGRGGERKTVDGHISKPAGSYIASVISGSIYETEHNTGNLNLSVFRDTLSEARSALLEYLDRIGGWEVTRWVVPEDLVGPLSEIASEEVILHRDLMPPDEDG